MGVVMSTTFISISSGVVAADLAVAAGGVYQAHGIGAALGSCVTMSVLQATLKPMLRQALEGLSGSDEVRLACYCESVLIVHSRS